MPWQCRMTMRAYYWNNLHHQHQSASVWPSSCSQSFRVPSSSRSLSTSTDHRIVSAGKKQHLPPIGHINFRQAPKNFQADMWATHTYVSIHIIYICYIQYIFWYLLMRPSPQLNKHLLSMVAPAAWGPWRYCSLLGAPCNPVRGIWPRVYSRSQNAMVGKIMARF